MAKKGSTNLFHFFSVSLFNHQGWLSFYVSALKLFLLRIKRKVLMHLSAATPGVNPGDKRGHGAGFVNFV